MKVFLSQTAGEKAEQIIDYLEKRWSEKVRDNFLEKLERSMEIIEQMPYSFPASQNFPGLRKCVISPQTIAIYRINEHVKEIEIIALIDTREDFMF